MNIINLKDHKIKKIIFNKDLDKAKLCRIRDDIEQTLNRYSIEENNLLAVSLSSGRFSAMNLVKIIGKDETISFFNDCIKTALKYN